MLFLINSVLLGIGLAMDAFSVSLANGLVEPRMKHGRMACIAGTFAWFQFFMPMLGWFVVHTMLQYFQRFAPFIPWISLALLGYIGGGMILEGWRGEHGAETTGALTWRTLFLQGIATSIDALSVGFTIADYEAGMAFLASVLIGAVTFFVCWGGLLLGKRFGLRFADKALLFGGCILVAIGIEIFVTGVCK